MDTLFDEILIDFTWRWHTEDAGFDHNRKITSSGKVSTPHLPPLNHSHLSICLPSFLFQRTPFSLTIHPSDALIYYQMIFINCHNLVASFYHVGLWHQSMQQRHSLISHTLLLSALHVLFHISHISIVCVAHDFQKGPTDYLFVHKNCFVWSRSWHCNSHHSSLFTGPSRQCNME